MPRSRVRKKCPRRGQQFVVQPHRPTETDYCYRCHHRWPCPSAVAGEDLPDTASCMSADDLPADVYDHAALAAFGLIEDTGRRRRIGDRLQICWSLSSKGQVLAPDLHADLQRHGTAPCEEDMRRVLQWLGTNGSIYGTRRTVAQQCAEALDWPATHVERCLLWAEVKGLVQGPDNT